MLPGASPLIEFQDVSRIFRRNGTVTHALDRVTLGVKQGEFVALVGPSGCGKSTLLNLTTGLIPPTSGQVLYGGAPVQTVNSRVGYITQQDTLLPWRTVYGNLAVGLEIQGVPPKKRRDLIERQLEAVGLKDFARHYPSELSGGMRKRVQLGRTLIYNPETLLMDEPFGAVDAQLRLVLQEELLHIYDRLGTTVLFVTHDLEEALLLADRVVVFSARPARVKHIQVVDVPRPRDIHSVKLDRRFAELYAELWNQMRDDIRRGETI